MSENLCIRCQHHEVISVASPVVPVSTREFLCKISVDVVTGVEGQKTCYAERKPEGSCGPSGLMYKHQPRS